jgi:hypothetical protein
VVPALCEAPRKGKLSDGRQSHVAGFAARSPVPLMAAACVCVASTLLTLLSGLLSFLARRASLPRIHLRSLTAFPLSQEQAARLIGGALPAALHVFSCLVSGIVGTRHVTHIPVWVVF